MITKLIALLGVLSQVSLADPVVIDSVFPGDLLYRQLNQISPGKPTQKIYNYHGSVADQVSLRSEPVWIVRPDTFTVTNIHAYYASEATDFFVVARVDDKTVLLKISKDNYEVSLLVELTAMADQPAVFATMFIPDGASEATARVYYIDQGSLYFVDSSDPTTPIKSEFQLIGNLKNYAPKTASLPNLSILYFVVVNEEETGDNRFCLIIKKENNKLTEAKINLGSSPLSINFKSLTYLNIFDISGVFTNIVYGGKAKDAETLIFIDCAFDDQGNPAPCIQRDLRVLGTDYSFMNMFVTDKNSGLMGDLVLQVNAIKRVGQDAEAYTMSNSIEFYSRYEKTDEKLIRVKTKDDLKKGAFLYTDSISETPVEQLQNMIFYQSQSKVVFIEVIDYDGRSKRQSYYWYLPNTVDFAKNIADSYTYLGLSNTGALQILNLDMPLYAIIDTSNPNDRSSGFTLPLLYFYQDAQDSFKMDKDVFEINFAKDNEKVEVEPDFDAPRRKGFPVKLNLNNFKGPVDSIELLPNDLTTKAEKISSNRLRFYYRDGSTLAEIQGSDLVASFEFVLNLKEKAFYSGCLPRSNSVECKKKTELEVPFEGKVLRWLITEKFIALLTDSKKLVVFNTITVTFKVNEVSNLGSVYGDFIHSQTDVMLPYARSGNAKDLRVAVMKVDGSAFLIHEMEIHGIQKIETNIDDSSFEFTVLTLHGLHKIRFQTDTEENYTPVKSSFFKLDYLVKNVIGACGSSTPDRFGNRVLLYATKNYVFFVNHKDGDRIEHLGMSQITSHEIEDLYCWNEGEVILKTADKLYSLAHGVDLPKKRYERRRVWDGPKSLEDIYSIDRTVLYTTKTEEGGREYHVLNEKGISYEIETTAEVLQVQYKSTDGKTAPVVQNIVIETFDSIKDRFNFAEIAQRGVTVRKDSIALDIALNKSSNPAGHFLQFKPLQGIDASNFTVQNRFTFNQELPVPSENEASFIDAIFYDLTTFALMKEKLEHKYYLTFYYNLTIIFPIEIKKEYIEGTISHAKLFSFAGKTTGDQVAYKVGLYTETVEGHCKLIVITVPEDPSLLDSIQIDSFKVARGSHHKGLVHENFNYVFMIETVTGDINIHTNKPEMESWVSSLYIENVENFELIAFGDKIMVIGKIIGSEELRIKGAAISSVDLFVDYTSPISNIHYYDKIKCIAPHIDSTFTCIFAGFRLSIFHFQANFEKKELGLAKELEFISYRDATIDRISVHKNFFVVKGSRRHSTRNCPYQVRTRPASSMLFSTT